MQHKKIVSGLVFSGFISSPVTTFANDNTELEELRGQAQELRQQLQELSQQVKVLARKGEIAEEETVATKKTAPVVKASEKGFGLESADGKNVIKLRGLLQADYRSFQNGASDVRNRSNQRAGSLDANGFHDANDTGLLRRVRPTIEATLLGKYDFRFTPDFGNGGAQVVDAYIDARLNPAFKIRAGKYKPFVGLERLQGGGAGTNTVITPNTNKTLSHDAWQIAASYLITGEDASFKGVKPKQHFDTDKGG